MRFRFSITLHSRLSLCSFYLIEPCLRASILLLTLWKRGKRSRLSTSCCYAQQTKEYLDHENMIREVYKLQQFLTQLDQRETVADRLDEMLGKWVESIPESYRGDTLPGFGPVQLRYFKQLRVTYYHCIFSILQAALRNKEWVDRLLSFGKARKEDDTDTPLLASNWSDLVTAARKCSDILATFDNRGMAFRW